MQLVVDMLTFRLQRRQGLRSALGEAVRKWPQGQRQAAKLGDRGIGSGGVVTGRIWARAEGRSRARREDESCRESPEPARARRSRAGLLEMPLPSRSSAHAVIIALTAGSADDSPGSRLRPSNNMMSPGALDATMQLRPLDLAR